MIFPSFFFFSFFFFLLTVFVLIFPSFLLFCYILLKRTHSLLSFLVVFSRHTVIDCSLPEPLIELRSPQSHGVVGHRLFLQKGTEVCRILLLNIMPHQLLEQLREEKED